MQKDSQINQSPHRMSIWDVMNDPNAFPSIKVQTDYGEHKEVPARILSTAQGSELWLSGRLKRLANHDFTHVLNLSGFPNEPLGSFVELRIDDCQDTSEQDMTHVFERSLPFIHSSLQSPGAKVLVHCYAGVSRSATVVCAYMLKHPSYHSLNVDQVLSEIRKTRPQAYPNENFMKQLYSFQRGFSRNS